MLHLTTAERSFILSASLNSAERARLEGVIGDFAFHVHAYLWRNCNTRLSSEALGFEDDAIRDAYHSAGIAAALSLACQKARALFPDR